jgi:acyl-homoserine lactone acylase PvdQ
MILNKEVKDSIFSMITTPVKQDANGQALNAVMAKRAEDPIKYALMEAYFVKLGLFDGKFDKIVAKAKTQAVKELETKLSTNNNTNYISGGDGLGGGGESEYAKEFGAAFSRIKI